jgi:hypothetical protein
MNELLEDKLRDIFAKAMENYKVGRGSPVELIAVASSLLEQFIAKHSKDTRDELKYIIHKRICETS